jgi:tRNA1(Val) A37 N6-methylase TrmN6
MIFEYHWAMPSHETFKIKPIKELLNEEVVGDSWIDPFSRNSKFANITNDLNPNTSAEYHMDALDFLKMFDDESIDGVLFDPPYSPRQLKEMYEDIGMVLHDTKSSVWSNWKKEISRIVKPGGKVISFGWNTSGIGKKLGFTKKKIILICHGGNHNDTIVLIESKGKSLNYPTIQQTNLLEDFQ